MPKSSTDKLAPSICPACQAEGQIQVTETQVETQRLVGFETNGDQRYQDCTSASTQQLECLACGTQELDLEQLQTSAMVHCMSMDALSVFTHIESPWGTDELSLQSASGLDEKEVQQQLEQLAELGLVSGPDDNSYWHLTDAGSVALQIYTAPLMKL